MKKIKSLFFPLAVVMLLSSCEDDGGTSKRDLLTGGVPNIEKVGTLDSFINLNEIQSGNNISIGVTAEVGQGDVVSMNIVGYYIKGASVERAILASNVTTFPSTITLSQQDLIDKFTILNTADDFELGDQLKISADITLRDGTVLNLLNTDGTSNYGQDITNSALYSVVQTYNVSCPSDLAGTYSVLSSGSSTDGGATNNPISNYAYTTTFTDNGGGSYTLSDAFGGVYIAWYTVYGLDFEVTTDLSDVCGTLSGAFTDPFGGDVILNGTVNDDGTITIDWSNSFGDVGQSVYTLN